jgi:hypothetical protein
MLKDMRDVSRRFLSYIYRKQACQWRQIQILIKMSCDEFFRPMIRIVVRIASSFCNIKCN